MVYDKPYLSIREQVELLQARGLVIDNVIEAEQVLQQINYYRFAAFALPFQSQKDTFDHGTTLQHILSVYSFDTRLRSLILTALEKVEIQLKTLVALYLGETYGPFGYADKNNFGNKVKQSDWLQKTQKEINRSRETFVGHFKSKYPKSPNLPIWMLTEVMSLGSLSFLVNYLSYKDQKNISKKMGIKKGIAVSWLHHLTYVRNLCAHHSRLWNRIFAIRPMLPHNIGWGITPDKADNIFCTLKIIQNLSDQFALDVDVIKTTKTLIKSHSTVPLDLKKIMGFNE